MLSTFARSNIAAQTIPKTSHWLAIGDRNDPALSSWLVE